MRLLQRSFRVNVRHITRDVTSKKFLVSHLKNYAMVDDSFVMEQFCEIEKNVE